MLRNRLFATGVFLFTFGIAVEIYLNEFKMPFFLLCIGVLCVLLCTVHFLHMGYKPKVIAVFCFLPVLGMLFCTVYQLIFIIPYNTFDGNYIVTTAKITDIPRNTQYDEFLIKISDNNANIPENTVVSLRAEKGSTNYHYGDIIKFSGILQSVTEQTGYTSKNIYFICYSDPELVSKSNNLIYSLKNKFIAKIDSAFDFEEAELIKTITIDDTSKLGGDFYAVLTALGTVHLLSVSGFHLSLLVMTLYQILTFFSVNKYIRNGISIFIAMFYCALTGFSLPAMRSVFMVCIMLTAQMMFYQSDSITLLFAAAAILLIINPLCLASLSFQLSFLSTLGILSISDRVNFMNPFKKVFPRFVYTMIVPSFIFSFTSMIFTFPILAASFNRISIVSPIINVIVPFIFNPLLIFCLVFLIFSYIAPFLIYPAGFFARLFINTSKMLYKFEYSSVSTHTVFISVGIIISALGIVFILFAGKKLLHKAALYTSVFIFSLMGVSVFFSNHVNDNGLTIAFYQNRFTETVFAAKGDECLVIDTKGAGASIEMVYLNNFVKIDSYIILEYNQDIISKLDYFITEMRISNVYLPDPVDEEQFEIYNSIKNFAYNKNFKIKLIRGSIANIKLNGCNITVTTNEDYGYCLYFETGLKTSIIAKNQSTLSYLKADFAIFTDYNNESEVFKAEKLIVPYETEIETIIYNEKYYYKFFDTINIYMPIAGQTEVFINES